MIVVDSGPLIAAAIEDDWDHRRCRYVRGPAYDLREATGAADRPGRKRLHHPKAGTSQELLFLQSIAEGDLTLGELVPEDMNRVIDLVDTYYDYPLGTHRCLSDCHRRTTEHHRDRHT